MNRNLILIFALLLSVISNQSRAETHLHISTGFTPPVSDFFNSVLSEADKRLTNIKISFEVLPAERSLVLVDQGINDGECCRIPAVLVEQYQNLLPIDESFFSARFSAFAKGDKKPVSSFADLKPYSVGTVEGWKIAVKKIKAIEPAEVHIVTTPEQLMQMLDKDRLDYGVVGYLSGIKSISMLNIDNVQAIDPPLVEKPLFLILNKKHKALIPVFNQVLREMQSDGTINRLYSELIASLK